MFSQGEFLFVPWKEQIVWRPEKDGLLLFFYNEAPKSYSSCSLFNLFRPDVRGRPVGFLGELKGQPCVGDPVCTPIVCCVAFGDVYVQAWSGSCWRQRCWESGNSMGIRTYGAKVSPSLRWHLGVGAYPGEVAASTLASPDWTLGSWSWIRRRRQDPLFGTAYRCHKSGGIFPSGGLDSTP